MFEEKLDKVIAAPERRSSGDLIRLSDLMKFPIRIDHLR